MGQHNLTKSKLVDPTWRVSYLIRFVLLCKILIYINSCKVWTRVCHTLIKVRAHNYCRNKEYLQNHTISTHNNVLRKWGSASLSLNLAIFLYKQMLWGCYRSKWDRFCRWSFRWEGLQASAHTQSWYREENIFFNHLSKWEGLVVKKTYNIPEQVVHTNEPTVMLT